MLLGFQNNAFADEKDKDKKKDQTSVTKTDSIKIKVNLDIHSDDTLVFDDYDEDDDDDKGDNSSIAAITIPGKVKTCIIPPNKYDGIDIASRITVLAPALDSFNNENLESEAMPPHIQTRIYPNPATANNQTIFVTHNLNSAVQVTVYTLSGQTILTRSFIEQKIELPGLATGLYLVNIAGENQSDTQRLLVK